MKFIYPQTEERGMVSLLSVLFFIILMSVVSVSFLRVVADQQTQVLQDDLSKGALAAARSGVEDAKRALLLCRSKSGVAQAACYDALSETACPGIFSTLDMRTQLSLDANSDGSIKAGDPLNANYQRYTCVTVTRDTPDYKGIASDGLGELIPLRATTSFNQVRISWHSTDSSGDGPATIPVAGAISLDSNPRITEWHDGAGKPYIAMPRIQLMSHDTTKTLSAQQDSTVGTFLVPNNSAGSTMQVNSIQPGGGTPPLDKRSAVNCTGAQTGYACTATLDLKFPQPATASYYLLLKSQYGTPHYKVELLNNGISVLFKDVQPEVDSTGAAGNAYKRILSRVGYKADDYFTANALESGTSVCKDFSVTATTLDDACSPHMPTPPSP